MKIIYLDMCCFNRPYDDQSQARIRLETEAKLLIQENIRESKYKLAWSVILDFECSKNPFPAHRQAIFQWRKLAANIVRATPNIIATAKQFEQQGIARFDALHVACALAAEVDIFVSTDDRLLKKCHRVVSQINAQRPAEALAILENWYED
jgi:hypothetical protein